MTGSSAKAAGRARVRELVGRFRKHEGDYLNPAYNETQARTEFVTPLLEALGWDVHNAGGQPLSVREVIEEATVEVGEEGLSKKPDYELRLARQRKVFVEAKKPSLRIDRDSAAAFQTRRYGFSASLPIAILTNFRQLVVYDCVPAPSETDEAHVARVTVVDYGDFEARFDELWDVFSRESVYSGNFDRRFAVGGTRRGADQFDDFFLKQVRRWRELLASDIHLNAPHLTPRQLTFAVQLFLCRIVFLRICEDREIERYETLKGVGADTFAGLMEILRRADEFYDSGLFNLLDDARLGLRVSDGVLQTIIGELYYPTSPYTFAVVETEVLGEIYELFLGEVLTIGASGAVEIIPKPEVRESGGVVPTPRFVVDAIAEKTILPAIAGKDRNALRGFTVADICCGSGVFLLAAYELLLDHYLESYVRDTERFRGETIYEIGGGQWRLMFEEKRRILLEHIRGVDIDAEAVEVSRFSLLLKLIENESAAALRDYVARARTRALPELATTIRTGNSLVSEREWVAALGPIPAGIRDSVNPFTWADEFPAEFASGGFNVIVGNPPYIRIQNMTAYSPEEVAFYQHDRSPYETARQDNFDKYALFLERSVSLIRADGRFGVIVPNKFMTIKSGEAVRRLLTQTHVLETIVHFGAQQVFGPGTSNYTCILILDRRGRDTVSVARVLDLEAWRYGRIDDATTVPAAEFTAATWDFADAQTRAVFDRVRGLCPTNLEAVADIYVGVQTSNDSIYIFAPTAEAADAVTLRWNERDWRIERGIVRPCRLDVPLEAYAPPKPDTWIIFPYEIVVGPKGPRARLFQPDEMERRFPGCWAYLTERRGELSRRAINGGPAAERQWYQFGRSQGLTQFDRPKAIWRTLSVEPQYTFDELNTVVTGGGNGPYYMLRANPDMGISDLFLLAVLNHPLSEAIVRTIASVFRGGYYSHGKQFVKDLPVPIPSAEDRVAIEELVKRLMAALALRDSARTPHERTLHTRESVTLRTQIDGRVSALLGLSAEDLAIVMAVPIPG
jgi:hypothetical protein